jgi:hypothetical protein
MTAPDQCCINVKKLLSIRRRPHMTLSGHWAAPKPATEHDRGEHSCKLGENESCHPGGRYPRKRVDSDRAMVTAGLAKEVEAVNQ